VDGKQVGSDPVAREGSGDFVDALQRGVLRAVHQQERRVAARPLQERVGAVAGDKSMGKDLLLVNGLLDRSCPSEDRCVRWGRATIEGAVIVIGPQRDRESPISRSWPVVFVTSMSQRRERSSAKWWFIASVKLLMPASLCDSPS
jgi:hypothetical protein